MIQATTTGNISGAQPPRRVWPWVVLAIVIIIPGCVIGIMTGMKHSDAFTLSLAKVRAHPEVKAALGEPIETGLFVTGEINVKNAEGNAGIQYTVQGPKGSGEAHVRATRQYSQWALDEVVVTLPDPDRRIFVIGPAPAPPPAATQ